MYAHMSQQIPGEVKSFDKNHKSISEGGSECMDKLFMSHDDKVAHFHFKGHNHPLYYGSDSYTHKNKSDKSYPYFYIMNVFIHRCWAL